MNMQMIWRIEHFLAVVRHGSFNAAARSENLSQPALTKSVKHLEVMLGVELLARLPAGVVLTEPGRLFYKRALDIEATWNALLTELKVQAAGTEGNLRIGGGPVYSTVFFPSMLASLLEKFPGLNVQVSTGSAAELFPMLKSGEILCYAGVAPDSQHNLGRDFETVLLHHQSNAIFAAKDHPLFLAKEVTAQDLLNPLWLTLYSALNATTDIEMFFSRANLPRPQVALKAHSVQIALKMLTNHKYIACIPVPLGQALYGSGLRQLDVEGFSNAIPTGLTYRKSVADFVTIKTIRSLLVKLTSAAVADWGLTPDDAGSYT